MTRKLCIVLHDVAPATWPLCARLLEMIDALGAPPVTLLVVPDWHARGRIDAAPAFLRALHARAARGDEIALHGFYHHDDAPPAHTPLDWLRRRVLTAGEGEDAALPAAAAHTRLCSGLELLRGQGWQVDGFVPPAWLASADIRGLLPSLGLRWTSTHAALVAFDGNGAAQRMAAPCLTASSRSAWRRVASRAWLRAVAQLVDRARLVRVGLHPADAEHPAMLGCWREVLAGLLDRRMAVTKSAAVAAMAPDCGDRPARNAGARPCHDQACAEPARY